MIFDAAVRSISNLLRRESRMLILKVLGFTILALIVLWIGFLQIFNIWILPWIDGLSQNLPAWSGWIVAALSILSSIGMLVGLVFLMAPTTTLVAGLFLDDVAGAIEQQDYPADRPGVTLNLMSSISSAITFSALVLGLNLIALVFYLIPGINVAIFFLLNGYLIGREYFEFAAMRHLPRTEAKRLRRMYAGTITLSGCLCALMLAIPFVNLLTPLFAAGLMVHLFKEISRRTNFKAA